MTLDARLAAARIARNAIIRAMYEQMEREWGHAYPGAAAMTAAKLGTSTEEVANAVAGAEQHTENPE